MVSAFRAGRGGGGGPEASTPPRGRSVTWAGRAQTHRAEGVSRLHSRAPRRDSHRRPPLTRLFLPYVLALLLAPALAAQTGGDVRRVVLTTGAVVVGVIADEDADPVVVRTDDGIERRVPRDHIDEITPLLGGRFKRVDPTRTRLVFSPTGRTIGRGRTRVGTLFYVVPNATVGLSDRVDLGGVFFSTFGLGGGGDVYAGTLGIKVGLVDTGTFAVAVGANAGGGLEDGGDSDYVLTPYGAVTVGNEVRSASASVTVFVGGTFGEGGVGIAPIALLAVGGEVQVSNRVKLLADASVPLGEGADDALDLNGVFAGVRLFGDRYAVDVSGVLTYGVVTDGAFPIAPLVSFSLTL